MQPSQSHSIGELYAVFATAEVDFSPKVLPVTVGTLLSFRIGALFEKRGSPSEEGARVGCRVVQMGLIQRSGVSFSDSQRFLLAEAINAALFFCPQNIVKFKKRSHCESLCSFVVDRTSQHCFVLLDEMAHGAEKKIRYAAALPFSLSKSSFIAVIKTNKTWRDENGRAHLLVNQKLFSMFSREMAARKGEPAFPKAYTVFQYMSSRAPFVDKLLCIEEKLESAESSLFCDLESRDQIEFVRQFLHHVAHMYPRIHGDVKITNVLYKRTETGVDAKLIDLGFFCYPQYEFLHDVMRQGWYGSVFCTAPEAIGKDPRSLDWYKMESWAAGCALYSWLTGKFIPWGMDFCDARDSGCVPDKESVRTKVVAACERISTMARETSSQGVIAKVCLDLLELSPEKRPDMRGAEKRFLGYCDAAGRFS